MLRLVRDLRLAQGLDWFHCIKEFGDAARGVIYLRRSGGEGGGRLLWKR